ncbi:MAG TPA: hypothetical protein ENJ95_06895 [Bacteroidetes bacterium]|nr:hypothetical protein [Bacteroidota bacterium]
MLTPTTTVRFRPSPQIATCTDECNIPSNPIGGTLNSTSCSSGLSVELLYGANGTDDFAALSNHILTSSPHEEIPVYVQITNNGLTSIDIDDLDLKLSLSDIYGTLPDITDLENYFVEGTLPTGTPLYEEHNGDRHYFFLDNLSNPILAPNTSLRLLAFSIRPPDELENIKGQADIGLEYVRVLEHGGVCCTADVSAAFGTVDYPGTLPCTGEPIVSFSLSSVSNPNFNDCETGFEIVASVTGNGMPTSVDLVEIFLEFKTVGTENLEVLSITGPGGTFNNNNCNTGGSCPSGINASTCTDCSPIINFSNSNFLTLSDGDSYLVLLRGSDQAALETIDFTQAHIKFKGATESCVPNVDDTANFLPLVNNCTYCLDYDVRIAPYTASVPPVKECDQAFSVMLDAPAVNSLSKVTAEVVFQNPGNIPFQLYNVLCPSTDCALDPLAPPAGAVQVNDCAYISGNSVFYTYCPAGTFGGSTKLFDVFFSATENGCVSDIMFTMNTAVEENLTTCSPENTTLPGDDEVCITDCVKTYTGGGLIQDENGNGIDVPIDPAGSTLPATLISINSGVLIFNESCGSSSLDGVCDQLTSTIGSCTGNYEIDIQCNGNEAGLFSIMPKKDINPLNGVSTYDLVLISKHILGVKLLDSPYKIIAADANKSGSVTTYDIVLIRKVILHVETEFLNNTSWRFVHEDYVFPDPADPFTEEFPECIIVNLSNGSVTGTGFIAIKIGDVNDSHSCSSFTGNGADDRNTGIGLLASVNQQKSFAPGDLLEMTFAMDGETQLAAWQMGLRFDPSILQLERGEDLYGQDNLDRVWFGETEAKDGRIRALWYSADGGPVLFGQQVPVFKLHFKALRPVSDLTDLLAIDNGILQTAAYQADGSPRSLNLTLGKGLVSPQLQPQTPALNVQTIPNPFAGELRLYAEIPQKAVLEVAVFDIFGRQVAAWEKEVQAGPQEIVFDQTNGWGGGVFTWRATADGQVLTGKVVKQ